MTVDCELEYKIEYLQGLKDGWLCLSYLTIGRIVGVIRLRRDLVHRHERVGGSLWSMGVSWFVARTAG